VNDDRYLAVARRDALKRYEHGTRARYVLGKCRCVPCKKANAAYQKARDRGSAGLYRMWFAASVGRFVVKHRETGEIVYRGDKVSATRQLAKLNAEPLPDWLRDQDVARARRRYPHGTHARYHLGRCRCNPCLEAHNAYEKHRRENPDLRLIPAEPVIAHIRFLQSQGMGVKKIARAAGITQSVCARYVNDYRTITRVRRSTAERILALKPQPSPGARMRSDSTVVLIERLVAAGYRKIWIAHALGSKQPYLAVGRTPWVTVESAKRIHDLYVQLSRSNPALPPIDETFVPSEMEPTAVRVGYRWKSGTIPELPLEAKKELYPHGTVSRYRIVGCRCIACKKAHQEHTRVVQNRELQPFILRKESSLGKSKSYVVRDRQRELIVFRSADRRRAEKMCRQLNLSDPFYHGKTLVDAKDVRLHLQALIAAGTSIVAIARGAGITDSHVLFLSTGRLRRTRMETAQKLLAVTSAESTPYERVDAAPVLEMIDQLKAVGFEDDWLKQLLGFEPNATGPTMQLWRARAVMRLYAQLQDRVALLRALSDAKRKDAA